jgi:KDO transferase-3
MSKISRFFKIVNGSGDGVIVWKNEEICTLVPMTHVLNTARSRTAYIVASGPSLKRLDITPLKNRYTFGVNGSIIKFLEQGICPEFYVIADEAFIYNRTYLLKDILQPSTHCFFTPQVLSAICEVDPELLKGHPKITLFDNHFKPYGKKALEYEDIVALSKKDSDIVTQDGRIGFSLNPEKGVFTAHTVPYFALQIAYGIGFREIYLVGLDLGSTNQETRFYEGGKSAMPSHLDRDYQRAILPSFEVVKELIDKDVLKVFNLSPVSRLPDNVIPKKDFNDAI